MNPEPITANADRIVGLSNRALCEFGKARISLSEFKAFSKLYETARNNLQKTVVEMERILHKVAEQSTIECKANATQTTEHNNVQSNHSTVSELT